MQDGNLTNTTFTVTKVAEGGGGYHFDVVVETDVAHPTGYRLIAPGESTISAKVFRYSTSVQLGATTAMTPGAGVKYTATVAVDDAEIPIGEWMYAVAEAKWVVDASDSETTLPKKAPA